MNKPILILLLFLSSFATSQEKKEQQLLEEAYKHVEKTLNESSSARGVAIDVYLRREPGFESKKKQVFTSLKTKVIVVQFIVQLTIKVLIDSFINYQTQKLILIVFQIISLFTWFVE